MKIMTLGKSFSRSFVIWGRAPWAFYRVFVTTEHKRRGCHFPPNSLLLSAVLTLYVACFGNFIAIRCHKCSHASLPHWVHVPCAFVRWSSFTCIVDVITQKHCEAFSQYTCHVESILHVATKISHPMACLVTCQIISNYISLFSRTKKE